LPRRSARPAIITVVPVVVALALGFWLGWALHARRNQVHVVHATSTAVNADGTAIGANGEGYVVGDGVTWRGMDGAVSAPTGVGTHM
jgi:hypothetical protein